jgi:uncharacterized protein (TIGR02246 family)
MTMMNTKDLIEAVQRADQAINRRDIAALMDFYEEDASLVIQPGRVAHGKTEIAMAFEAIFRFFNQSLVVSQTDFQVVEGGGVALVVCNLKLSAEGATSSPVSMERRPTYVFRRAEDGQWRCLIDNSYGVDLVNGNA